MIQGMNKQSEQEQMDAIVDRVMPLLQGLAQIFGQAVNLTLVAQAPEAKGCVIFSSNETDIDRLVEDLRYSQQLGENKELN